MARKDIEELFETKVYLDLYVKVREKWRDNENILNKVMGYNEEAIRKVNKKRQDRLKIQKKVNR